MANQQNLADVLQAIGFSELIESFESEPLQDLETLLTDFKVIEKVVPQLQREEFIEKIQNFFEADRNYDSEESSENGDLERARQENVDINNIHAKPQPNTVRNNIFSIENVDIREILKSSFEGRQILAWHDAKSFLKPGQRRRLVHHVIAGVMNCCERSLHDSDFKILSQKIVELFKKECALVYYEARIPKKASNTGVAKRPKGKLFNKYKNLLKSVVNVHAVEKVATALDKEDYESFLNDDIEESVEWLKNQEEPWEETLKHWEKTANYRQAQVENEFKNKISSMYEEWPVLKSPKGYLLILEDFVYRKFNNKNDSIDNFKVFFDQAIAAKPLRKDEHVDLLQGILLKPNLNEDTDTLIRLMLLCILIPSTARIPVGNKKMWKPSAVESFDGIVTRIKIHGDIEKTRLERHQFAKSRNLTVQPYIIVVEEGEYEVQSTYLCIDAILYEMPSVLEALDACFKSFHALKADYTVQSEHIWLLLQLGLYQFRTMWDTSITDVTAILNDMGILLPFAKS